MSFQRAISRTLLAAVLIAGFVGNAQARQSTKDYTCESLQRYIEVRGAVVMNTKNANVYNRFVAHSGFCERGEGVEYHTVPTRNGSCRLKICVDIYFDEFLRRR